MRAASGTDIQIVVGSNPEVPHAVHLGYRRSAIEMVITRRAGCPKSRNSEAATTVHLFFGFLFCHSLSFFLSFFLSFSLVGRDFNRVKNTVVYIISSSLDALSVGPSVGPSHTS